jgi:hypothetical protein
VVGLSRHGDGRARDLGRVQPAEWEGGCW